jgi:2-methylcitrate dehydratase PrpD
MSTFAEALSEWAVDLNAKSVPPDELELARCRIADTAGLLAAGHSTKASLAAVQLARVSASGTLEAGASMIGQSGRWPFPWAAFVHGVTAHCRDFDDTFPQSVVHPGSTIVSTAMAVGEALRANDDNILTAVVAGYEIGARLGLAGGRNLIPRGFHGTGVYGPIISAVVAGKLLNLSARQMASAIGLATSMSSGLFEFQTDGSWSKWLHVGWSCLGGCTAAQLASNGFKGPITGLEGGRGLYAAFIGLDKADLSSLTAGLGKTWLARTALPKYYPCAHVIQPYIDAGRNLSKQIDPSQIKEINCHIAPWAVSLVCEPLARKQKPQSEMDVIGSLPFLVAASIVDGNVTLEHLDQETRARSDILALAARVTYTADAKLGESFDGRLDLVRHDGTRESHDVRALETSKTAILKKSIILLTKAFSAPVAEQICKKFVAGESLAVTWNEAMAVPGRPKAKRHA